MAADRLDEAKTEILRQWGTGLAATGRDEELRAAGRAIVFLVEETDALQRDVWHERARVSDQSPKRAQAAEAHDQVSLVDILGAKLIPGFPALP